ncbi:MULTISPECIES: RagB/SusD family nutrient uptake outer membrane protein [Flavobacterium]|uniref:RagB/SusD family nutrient uptake outer membrane protein n=1 Tax=Flavobacterium jumunjinense TaxID=998845 RepID=A0ABV5GSG2_9FLAO|nr:MULTISPECIES: RagB/SusD family nutrient uptake outer membrane protein [Flavobacterium]
MKRIFYSFIFLVIASLAFVSCDVESYLSEPQPTDEVAGSVVTPELALVGMYGAYRDFYGGAHDVATSKSFDLGSEVMGRDLQVPDFNWYIFEHRWDVVASANARRNVYIWEMFYKLVFHANNVMYVLDINSDGMSQDRIDAYRGQALSMRALAFYNLVRTFQFTYAKNPNLPGIPLDLSVADAVGKPRGTVQQVYDQIYSDLNEAISLLGTNRFGDKYRVNVNVAKGIFARVALEKQDYTRAQQMAADAQVGFPLMDNTTYVAGFNDYNNAEWLWGFPFIASENWGFASFYSFIDHDRAAGYKDIFINSDFYNLFGANDIRRSLIVTTGQTLASGKMYRTRKFRDVSDLTGNLVCMRASEMKLIEIEAKAHSNLVGAKQDLLTFQLLRDPDAVLSTAADLNTFIDEVLVERRKELYGEIGVDFYDMKRHQKSMQRVGNATRAVVGYGIFDVVPATSNNWNMLIPQREIDLNPNISQSDQNPVD